MKLQKVKDSWGETIGYTDGKHFLMKIPTWGNSYEWGINTTGKSFYFSSELADALDEGELLLVDSFREGKELMEALFNLA